MNEIFSLIIPTMWRSRLILEMLPQYQECPLVGEIIIIDNDPDHRPDISLSVLSKVSIYTKGHNIYVNPAWNWGASLARYTITLVNDDIMIQGVTALLSTLSKYDYDIIGARINNIFADGNPNESAVVDAPAKFPCNSYGCFMVVRQNYYIPEQLKIHAGDNHLFCSVKKRGILRTGEFIQTQPSVTIKAVSAFSLISAMDRRFYKEMLKVSSFNIIIRTSNRPNYFAQCVKSIRHYAPHALLHITIDNERDLDYVTHNCQGLNWKYYLVNREVVQNFCSKIEISRRPFIYNYYFNVVRPFLMGWCMILDDDDKLVARPGYLNDINHITLHRVDVGKRIVPPDDLFGKEPVLNNISALGIIFHASHMIPWNPQRGGDFDFISTLYSRYKPIWLNCVVAVSQTGGNFGRRNDLSH